MRLTVFMRSLKFAGSCFNINYQKQLTITTYGENFGLVFLQILLYLSMVLT